MFVIDVDVLFVLLPGHVKFHAVFVFPIRHLDFGTPITKRDIIKYESVPTNTDAYEHTSASVRVAKIFFIFRFIYPSESKMRQQFKARLAFLCAVLCSWNRCRAADKGEGFVGIPSL